SGGGHWCDLEAPAIRQAIDQEARRLDRVCVEKNRRAWRTRSAPSPNQIPAGRGLVTFIMAGSGQASSRLGEAMQRACGASLLRGRTRTRRLRDRFLERRAEGMRRIDAEDLHLLGVERELLECEH